MRGNKTVFEVVGVDMVVQEDMAVVTIADDEDGVDGADGADGVYKDRCQRVSFLVLRLSSTPASVSYLSQGKGTSYNGLDRNHHGRRNGNGLLYDNSGRESLSRRVKKRSKVCH